VTANLQARTVSVPNGLGGVAQLVRAIACHAKSISFPTFLLTLKMKGITACLNLLGNIGVYLELRIKYFRLYFFGIFLVPISYRLVPLILPQLLLY
jgi:hypothetical protein